MKYGNEKPNPVKAMQPAKTHFMFVLSDVGFFSDDVLAVEVAALTEGDGPTCRPSSRNTCGGIFFGGMLVIVLSHFEGGGPISS